MVNRKDRYQQAADLVDRQMVQLGLSQAEVERRSGVNAFTIRKVMNGVENNYRRDNLVKIAVALDLPPDALLKLLPQRRAKAKAVDIARDASQGSHELFVATAEELQKIRDRVKTLEEEMTEIQGFVPQFLALQEAVAELARRDRRRRGREGS